MLEIASDLPTIVGVIDYPQIDPVIFSFELFGREFSIRWYSFAYIGGLFFGWWYIRRLCARPGAPMSPAHMDDMLIWAAFGIILGGRLGSVLFYNLPYYLQNPLQVFILWNGGMSFHGGAIGLATATFFFCRRHKLDFLRVGDIVALVSPIGLLAGRLANFINGELWGRPTDVPWAMIFPSDPIQVPRHPSQLYEAFGEGVLLFALLMFIYHRTSLPKKRPGSLIAVILIGYAIIRFLIEFVREPDAHIGLTGWISRGQLLTIPMLLIGLAIFWFADKRYKEVSTR